MDKERHLKYAAIMGRATEMGLMKKSEAIDRMMDIESADGKFNLRLEDWLGSDDISFSNDFIGIRNNIVRCDFPAMDFGSFVPKFAEKTLNLSKEVM